MKGEEQYNAFCKALKEYREAIHALNEAELDNGWKCAAILYLELGNVAPVLLKMAAERLEWVGKEKIKREIQLMMA